MEISIGSSVTWPPAQLEKWSEPSTHHLSGVQGSGEKWGVALWAHNKWCKCLIEMGNKALNASWHADLRPERTQTPISITEWTTNKQSQDIKRVCMCVWVSEKSSMMNNAQIISSCWYTKKTTCLAEKIMALLGADFIKNLSLKYKYILQNLLFMWSMTLSHHNTKITASIHKQMKDLSSSGPLSSQRVPLAKQCDIEWNQTINVKLQQISNIKQLKWN